MKIFSEILASQDGHGKTVPVFLLYLDTQKTNNQEKDCVSTGIDFTSMQDCNDPEMILGFLIPLISELVYNAYGEPSYRKDMQPLQSAKQTGFDPSCVNGVKGCKLK